MSDQYIRRIESALRAGPTAGMNMAQRILHVGGRNNKAGYVEFGSIQAVEALVQQVIRDLPKPTLRLSEPMSHAEQDALLIGQGFTGSVRLTRDVGPYDISEATPRARDIVSAIEAETIKRVKECNK